VERSIDHWPVLAPTPTRHRAYLPSSVRRLRGAGFAYIDPTPQKVSFAAGLNPSFLAQKLRAAMSIPRITCSFLTEPAKSRRHTANWQLFTDIFISMPATVTHIAKNSCGTCRGTYTSLQRGRGTDRCVAQIAGYTATASCPAALGARP
jgi:hypothetical protein